MLNQPSNISPDEINGSGCVDLTQDLTVSWQVSGDTALTAYEIVFYANDASTTQLYTTGRVTLGSPFWGVNYRGQSQLFIATVPAASLSEAGLSNGNEYQFTITQYTTDTTDGIAQTTPSFFYARVTPTLLVDTIDVPVTERSLTITGSYGMFGTERIGADGGFYALSVGGITAASGSNTSNVKRARTGFLTTRIGALVCFDSDEYNLSCVWTYRQSSAGSGIRRILRDTPGPYSFVIIPAVNENNFRIAFSRPDDADLTTDVDDPTSDWYKIRHALHVYDLSETTPLAWVRWQIAESTMREDPYVDTGKIYGTGELQVNYDGFFPDTTYSVRLTAENTLGIAMDTGWVDFDVEYELATNPGTAKACQLQNENGVYIEWDRIDIAQGYSVFRQESGTSFLKKIADVDGTTGQVRDYSAKSGETYIYYVFPVGELAYLTEPLETNEITPQYYLWTVIEAQESAAEDDFYNVVTTHVFRMGEGGVNEGSFSNNNAPSLLKNFTPYPTWQPETANYLTGSVSGYIGSISAEDHSYSDTVSQSEALFQLSTTTNALFLSDPKGHFLRIRPSDAVSMVINHRKLPMPQTVSLFWAEVGSTEGISLTAAPGGDFYPTDAVITTTVRYDQDTGNLLWIVPVGYENGSTLIRNANGFLVQTADGSFTPAVMVLDQSTGEVSATI